MNSTFGVVTACWKGDYFLVKATCASIRHFLGDVPICVIVDGDFSIQELIDAYGVQPLYLSKLAMPELRQRCPGSSRAKLAAIWEGPFEYFLYLDSDAIVWGNVLEQLNSYIDNIDFVVMRPTSYGNLPKEEVNKWFFNIDRLLKIDPGFEWKNQPYFCAGVFAARRNCFDIQTYLNLEAIEDSNPGLFQFWDQGIVNYMVFSGYQNNTLVYEVIDLQVVTADHSKEKLEREFPCLNDRLPSNPERTAIIHFCGHKPFVHKLSSFSKPFTASRLLHYQNLTHHSFMSKFQARLAIIQEESRFLFDKSLKKLSKL